MKRELKVVILLIVTAWALKSIWAFNVDTLPGTQAEEARVTRTFFSILVSLPSVVFVSSHCIERAMEIREKIKSKK